MGSSQEVPLTVMNRESFSYLFLTSWLCLCAHDQFSTCFQCCDFLSLCLLSHGTRCENDDNDDKKIYFDFFWAVAFGTEQVKLLSFFNSNRKGMNELFDFARNAEVRVWVAKENINNFLAILMSFYLLFIGSDDVALLLIHRLNVFAIFFSRFFDFD